MYLVSALMNNKHLKKVGKVDFTAGMLMPYRAVLKKAAGHASQKPKKGSEKAR